MSLIERTDEDLADAKFRMLTAARRIDPLRPMRQHPYSTVGVGLVSGFLLGSKEHAAVTKTLRLSMSLVGLLKPMLLAAGKVAAARAAANVAESAADAHELRS